MTISSPSFLFVQILHIINKSADEFSSEGGSLAFKIMNQQNEPGPPAGNPSLSYALFHCDPFHEPPFDLELGFSDISFKQIKDCAHIPDALEKLEAFCSKENISRTPGFTLLYPIYLEAMDTDAESTMHNIAWLIKDQADKNKWNFARVDGYTGKSQMDFILEG